MWKHSTKRFHQYWLLLAAITSLVRIWNEVFSTQMYSSLLEYLILVPMRLWTPAGDIVWSKCDFGFVFSLECSRFCLSIGTPFDRVRIFVVLIHIRVRFELFRTVHAIVQIFAGVCCQMLLFKSQISLSINSLRRSHMGGYVPLMPSLICILYRRNGICVVCSCAWHGCVRSVHAD